MPPRPRAPQPEPDAAPEPVAYYIADVPLPVGTEMGAETIPARAFNPGDQVPVEHVEKYGWQPYTHPWPPPAAPRENVSGPETGSAPPAHDTSAGPETPPPSTAGDTAPPGSKEK